MSLHVIDADRRSWLAPARRRRSADLGRDDYEPRIVTVAAGTTVIWVNDGRNVHNVVSLTGDFGSGRMRSGDEFSFTFDAVGTFYYQCTVHWSMAGTVVVDKSETPAGS